MKSKYAIQSKILLTLGTIISVTSLTMPLISPSFAAGGGSHKTIKICGNIQYEYEGKDGKKHSGKTSPEECGKKFKQQHQETQESKDSRNEACRKSWQRLPRLEQGDKWLSRTCTVRQKA